MGAGAGMRESTNALLMDKDGGRIHLLLLLRIGIFHTWGIATIIMDFERRRSIHRRPSNRIIWDLNFSHAMRL